MALVRHIADVTAPAYDWTWVSRLDRAVGVTTKYEQHDRVGERLESGYRARTVVPERGSSAALRRVGWTIFQPGGTVLAPAVFGSMFRRSVQRQVPRDTAHIHWVGTGIELLGFEFLRLARTRGVPFSVLPALHPGEWGDAAIDGRLYRLADAVMALSDDERDRIVSLGADPACVHVVPLGPTVLASGNEQRFRARYAIPRTPVIAFLGRRSRTKGLEAVLEAVRRIREEGKDVVLAVAGPPGDVPAEALAEPYVLDLGLCDEQTKADLLTTCHVMALPSTAEAFGIVYLDAWACGAPVIASNPRAVRELVEDEVDGLRVEQHVPEVQEALSRLLDDGALRARLGAAGHAKQRERYTWERSAARHTEIFGQAAQVARERRVRRRRP
jgi:glycosyltransferase involved in cell wall biosynthesis